MNARCSEVMSLYPQKILGFARTAANSRYGTRLDELLPPIVVMMARTSRFAKSSLISAARSSGVPDRARRGRLRGQAALDHAETEPRELVDAVEVFRAEGHMRGKRRRADADRVSGAQGSGVGESPHRRQYA